MACQVGRCQKTIFDWLNHCIIRLYAIMQRQFDDTNLQMKIIFNKRHIIDSYTTGCGHMFDAYHGLLSGF
jgi:hypothetical protein